MDIRKPIEMLRAAMHKSVDKIIESVLESGNFLSNEYIKTITEENQKEFHENAKKIIESFEEPKEFTEEDMFVGLTSNGRTDILLLMNRAEKGELSGKKIMVNTKSTSIQSITMIRNFFLKHGVNMEVYD